MPHRPIGNRNGPNARVQAVLTAQGKPARDDKLPESNLDVSGVIPTDYVAHEGLRLELIAKAGAEASLEDIESELEDRFGPIPGELCKVTAIAKIRLGCRNMGISQVDAGPQSDCHEFQLPASFARNGADGVQLALAQCAAHLP